VVATLKVRPELLTITEVVHGGTLMAFADTIGAAGTAANLAPGQNTATIESKTNFFAAVDRCAARRGDAAAQGQAHARLADAHHRRGGQAALPHHPDPDDPVNGLAAAVLSSALGGSAAALTRYVIGATDPVTLAAYRFGIGFLLILPLA